MRWSLLVLISFLSGCARPCNRSTCDGCCASATDCVEGSSRLECGSQGEACTRCTTRERCAASKCEALPVVDSGVVDAGPPICGCLTSCCLPDGSCAPNNDISACGPVKEFCGTCLSSQRCERGTCVAGACAGCLDPLGACRGGTEDATCGSDGGVCVSCGADQGCRRGQCEFTRCDITNCRFGCCQPNFACTTPSPLACGVGGDPCAMCSGAQQCLGGSCQ